MEFLLGSLIAFFTQALKAVAQRYGVTFTRAFILGLVFLIVFTATLVSQAHWISKETIVFFGTVFSLSVATYEIIIKWLLKFAFFRQLFGVDTEKPE